MIAGAHLYLFPGCFRRLTLTASSSEAQYLTSPPVFLRDELPGELLVEVLPSLHDVRLADKFLPPAVLQHHLQLREIILALQPTLVEQSPVPDHVASGRFAYLSLGVTGRPRRIWLPFISQIANDGQVAFFTRHVSTDPRFTLVWVYLEVRRPHLTFKVETLILYAGRIKDEHELEMKQQHFKMFPKVELQFSAVRVDLPEQTKWLLHNRILRRQRRKHTVTHINHTRAQDPNFLLHG